MRPYVTTRAEGLGDVIVRSRSAPTAAVLLVDDSLATAAPKGDPALGRINRLAHAYLDTLGAGDEVSILTTATIGAPAGDPLFDINSAHSAIDHLGPSAACCDVPALIEAGLDRFARHLDPEAELVLLTDGRAAAFRLDDIARWRRIAARLGSGSGEPVGSRARPHLILLQPPPPSPPLENCAVESVRVDRALLPAGEPIHVHATLRLEGDRALQGLLAGLAIDGRTIDERPCALTPGSSADLELSYPAPSPGSHLLTVSISGARDALPEDDSRSVAIEVAPRIGVLLVEGRPGDGLGGSLGLCAAALSPDGSGPFAPVRVGVSGLSDQALAQARLVILGDVPSLDPLAVARLERYLAAGGGILVCAGPLMESEDASRFCWRGGDGFLPARLGVERPLAPPEHLVLGSGAALALAAVAQAGPEVLSEVSISRLHDLDEIAPDALPLIATEDGSPLAIARARGRGRVLLLATSLDGGWNDLPYRTVFVPLLRGLCTWLGGELVPPRDLLVGDALAWIGDSERSSAHLEGPDGQALPLSLGAWEGYRAELSPPLLEPGAYRVTAEDGRTVRYEVGTDARESRLAPLVLADLDGALPDVPRHLVRQPAQVRELFSAAGDRTWEMWRPLVVVALGLLALESLCTRWIARAPKAAP